MTAEELGAFFHKAGIIKKDPYTAEEKIKIYKDTESKPEEEKKSSLLSGLISYFRAESVALAVTLLDGAEIRPGVPLNVAPATFEHKGEAAKSAPRKSQSKKLKTYDQQPELDWEEVESTHVIIKYVFTQEEALEDLKFFEVLDQELREELEKFGPIDKMKIFEFNPEGVVVVKFKNSYAASMCVEKTQGRNFSGRKLEAFYYDGFANYEVKESEEHKAKRIAQFGDWLNQEEIKNDA